MSQIGLRLRRADALVLVVDVQERLTAAMDGAAMQGVRKGLTALVEGAKVLDVPVVVTEQYPKGLGHTIPELVQVLPAGLPKFEKSHFSCAAAPDVAKHVADAGRRQVVIAGMETHVCVYQTARDLVEQGYQVFVASDAVISRTEDNRRIGLGLMERSGAVITSTEAVLFDLLGEAGTPEFKAISKLVK